MFLILNAAQLRADFNNAKVLKAHESVDRMLAAQSRKSLQDGNEACFRVEFEEAAGAQQQPGWGSTRYVKSVLIRRVGGTRCATGSSDPMNLGCWIDPNKLFFSSFSIDG
jgi:hypothetical protein